jgi:MFS family permease
LPIAVRPALARRSSASTSPRRLPVSGTLPDSIGRCRRIAAIGVFTATLTAGLAAGLILGGVITSTLGWRWCGTGAAPSSRWWSTA